MTEAAPESKESDLGVRTVSAIIMLAVAGTALWLGGQWFAAFVVLVGFGLLWEYWGLVSRFEHGIGGRFLWLIAGIAYISAACTGLILMSGPMRLLTILIVIAVDIGAYFSGRRFGGKKIAPSISPSKTWAGLYGGIAGASLVLIAAWLLILSAISAFGSKPQTLTGIIVQHPLAILGLIIAGAVLAIVAQAGDFFESWMKRRAGVKDSGALIPGHGGLFDRVDGLMPIAIIFGALSQVNLS